MECIQNFHVQQTHTKIHYFYNCIRAKELLNKHSPAEFSLHKLLHSIAEILQLRKLNNASHGSTVQNRNQNQGSAGVQISCIFHANHLTLAARLVCVCVLVCPKIRTDRTIRVRVGFDCVRL